MANPIGKSSSEYPPTLCGKIHACFDAVYNAIAKALTAIKTFFLWLATRLGCRREVDTPPLPLYTPLERLKNDLKQVPLLKDLKNIFEEPNFPKQHPKQHKAHAQKAYVSQLRKVVKGLAAGKIELIHKNQPRTIFVELSHPDQVDSIITFIEELLTNQNLTLEDDIAKDIATAKAACLNPLLKKIIALFPDDIDHVEEIFAYAEEQTQIDLSLLKYMTLVVYSSERSSSQKINLLTGIAQQLPVQSPYAEQMGTLFHQFSIDSFRDFKFNANKQSHLDLRGQLESALTTIAEKLNCTPPEIKIEMETEGDESEAQSAQAAQILQLAADLQAFEPITAAVKLRSYNLGDQFEAQVLNALPTFFATQVHSALTAET